MCTVLQALKLSCPPSPRLTTRDYLVGAAVMLGLTALLVLVGIGVKSAGFAAAGEFLVSLSFFAGLQGSMLFTYLKGRPARVQVMMALGPLVIVAGILWSATWLAQAL